MKFKAELFILTLSSIPFFISSCIKGFESPPPVIATTLSQELVLHPWKANSCLVENMQYDTSETFTFQIDHGGNIVANSGKPASITWNVDSNKMVTIGNPMQPGPSFSFVISSYSGTALNISQVITYDPFGSYVLVPKNTGCKMELTK